jgi:hypothetical protein
MIMQGARTRKHAALKTPLSHGLVDSVLVRRTAIWDKKVEAKTAKTATTAKTAKTATTNHMQQACSPLLGGAKSAPPEEGADSAPPSGGADSIPKDVPKTEMSQAAVALSEAPASAPTATASHPQLSTSAPFLTETSHDMIDLPTRVSLNNNGYDNKGPIALNGGRIDASLLHVPFDCYTKSAKGAKGLYHACMTILGVDEKSKLEPRLSYVCNVHWKDGSTDAPLKEVIMSADQIRKCRKLYESAIIRHA